MDARLLCYFGNSSINELRPIFGKAIIPQIIAQNFFGIFVSLFCGE